MTSALLDSPTSTRQPRSDQQQDDSSQIVTFRLSQEEYGVDIMSVQEIIRLGEITELPDVPLWIRGLINLRGLVIPVIDLRSRFGLDTVEPTERSRIIVLNVDERTIGIIVDEVKEVLRFSLERVAAAPTGVTGASEEYVSGVVRLDDRLLLLLNIGDLLREEDSDASETSASAIQDPVVAR